MDMVGWYGAECEVRGRVSGWAMGREDRLVCLRRLPASPASLLGVSNARSTPWARPAAAHTALQRTPRPECSGSKVHGPRVADGLVGSALCRELLCDVDVCPEPGARGWSLHPDQTSRGGQQAGGGTGDGVGVWSRSSRPESICSSPAFLCESPQLDNHTKPCHSAFASAFTRSI